MSEEQAQIRAIIAGDRDAFAEMIKQYQGMVYRVCLKMTKQPLWAEDLAQEVFISVYQALPSFRQEARLSTWLYQITVRKCLDWRRMQQREWQHRSEVDYRKTAASTEQTPEQTLLAQERKEFLNKLIDRLPKAYQKVVKLHYFYHYSYQEISERTNIPIKTIESQLYRARKMMKKRGGTP